MVEGGRTPLLPGAKLRELGYNLLIYPTASTYVTTKAMVDLMEGLKRDDTTATMIDMMIDLSLIHICKRLQGPAGLRRQ